MGRARAMSLKRKPFPARYRVTVTETELEVEEVRSLPGRLCCRVSLSRWSSRRSWPAATSASSTAARHAALGPAVEPAHPTCGVVRVSHLGGSPRGDGPLGDVLLCLPKLASSTRLPFRRVRSGTCRTESGHERRQLLAAWCCKTHMSSIAIRHENLTRDFGTLRAVDAISLEVPAGAVFWVPWTERPARRDHPPAAGLLEPTSGQAQCSAWHSDHRPTRSGAKSGALSSTRAFTNACRRDNLQ